MFFLHNHFGQKNPRVREIFVRNSGPEMGAPILWAPGIFAFFLQENLHVHKIPRFRGGGGILVFLLGGECRFYFYGRGDFFDLAARIGTLVGFAGPPVRHA